jgi:hypothetical protein
MNKQQIFKHPSLRQKGKKNIEQEIFGRFHHRWALSISVGAPVNIFFRFRINSFHPKLGILYGQTPSFHFAMHFPAGWPRILA